MRALTQIEKLMDARNQIQEQLNEIYVLKADNALLRQQVAVLEDQTRIRAADAVKRASPLKLKDAVDKFFASPDGTSANGGWRKIIRWWCTRLAMEIGNETSIQELEAVAVIEHIKKYGSKSATTAKKLTFNLCRFLDHQSYGGFDSTTVKRTILESLPKTEDKWIWFDREGVESLVAWLEHNKHEYWADAVMLAYGTGARVEEIPLLQTAKCVCHIKTGRIEIAPIFDDEKKLIRRLKTDKSEARIDVPTFALPALRRRMQAKNFLLFPRLPEFKLPRRERKVQTDWEQDHQMWPSADEHIFSWFFLDRVRKAADAVKPKVIVEGERKKRKVTRKELDSRIFRRTCAYELIKLHKSYDVAAAILRHDIKTLKAHYADILPSDFSTER